MPQGFTCRPSCVHVTTSQNSSNVPNPPGSITNGADNMEFRQPLVTDLAPHKVFRDDANRLAARPQHRVREPTHQSHIAAAVHQSNVAPCQFCSKLLGGSAVLGAAAGTGAAENADSFHAGILNLASPTTLSQADVSSLSIEWGYL